MEVFVPRGETALREFVKRVESEGHCYGFAASLLLEDEAFAKPKDGANLQNFCLLQAIHSVVFSDS